MNNGLWGACLNNAEGNGTVTAGEAAKACPKVSGVRERAAIGEARLKEAMCPPK